MSMGIPQGTSGGGGLLNILGGILGGIHQQNVAQQQLKDDRADQVIKQQEAAQNLQMNQLQMQKGQLDITAAQAAIKHGVKVAASEDLTNLQQQLIKDPSRASDPAFIAKYNQLSTAAGQVPTLTKKGAIDVNQFKPSFATSSIATDPKQAALFAQLPTATQNAILDGYADVPKNMRDQKPWVTFKDQTARDRVNNLHADTAEKNAIVAHLDEVKAKFYDAETGTLIPARAAQYRAGAALDATRGTAIVTMANAAATRAAAYTQSVQNVQQKFLSNPNGSKGAVSSLLSTSSTQLRALRTSLDDANKNLINAQLNSTDPDVIAEAQTAVDALKTQVEDATTAFQTLQQSVSSNPQVASHLSAASGKPAKNVGTGSNAKTLYSTSGGRPIVSKDGGKTWNFI